IHDCTIPSRQWPHVQPGVLICRTLPQVGVTVSAEHIEWPTGETVRLGAMSLHDCDARRDVRSYAGVEPYCPSSIEQFDRLPGPDTTRYGLVRMQTRPGSALVMP